MVFELLISLRPGSCPVSLITVYLRFICFSAPLAVNCRKTLATDRRN